MSRREWEEGKVALPTAEFARVRKAVEEADRKDKQAAFDQCQTFWGTLSRKQKTDPHEFERAIFNYSTVRRPGYVVESDSSKLSRTAHEMLSRARYASGNKPARPTREDAQFPTNRTTSFRVGEASIDFDKDDSSVTWHVPENNRARDRAHDHPVAQALFETLGTVRWTSRCGGVFTGNDEYHQEDTYAGGGANYHTRGFGPLGALEAPNRTEPYQDSKGQWWRPVTELGRYGFIGKVEPVDKRRGYYGSTEWVTTGKVKSPVPPTPASGLVGRQTGQGRVGRGRPTGGQFTSQGRTAPGGW